MPIDGKSVVKKHRQQLLLHISRTFTNNSQGMLQCWRFSEGVFCVTTRVIRSIGITKLKREQQSNRVVFIFFLNSSLMWLLAFRLLCWFAPIFFYFFPCHAFSARWRQILLRVQWTNYYYYYCDGVVLMFRKSKKKSVIGSLFVRWFGSNLCIRSTHLIPYIARSSLSSELLPKNNWGIQLLQLSFVRLSTANATHALCVPNWNVACLCENRCTLVHSSDGMDETLRHTICMIYDVTI